jgi:hypothetical protein
VLVGNVNVVRNDSLDSQLSYLPYSLNHPLQNLRVADLIFGAFYLNVEGADELEGTNVNLLRSDEKSCHVLRGYLGKMESWGSK